MRWSKSIFFLIEELTRVEGMGVLLAYEFLRSRRLNGLRAARQLSTSRAVHPMDLLPYVLMNPRLILAVILGGMTGVFA